MLSSDSVCLLRSLAPESGLIELLAGIALFDSDGFGLTKQVVANSA